MQEIDKNQPQVAISEIGTKLKSGYSIEEVDLVLNTLVMYAENYSHTCKVVDDEFGIKITAPTVKKWITTLFPSRYLHIQSKLHDTLNDQAKEKVTALTLRGVQLEQTLLDRVDKRLDEEDDISVKDLATSFNAITSGTEKHFKMKQILEDKPTQIVEVRTVEQAIKELEDDDLIVDAVVLEDDDEIELDSPDKSDSQ